MGIQIAQCSRRYFHSENKEEKAVSFLHEKMFFHDGTCKVAKKEQLIKFQPFLKTSIFWTLEATLSI